MRTSLILLVTMSLASAADVELILSNGRTVHGELVSENNGVAVVRTRFPVRGGFTEVSASYPASDVVRRSVVPGPLEQYADRAARAPDTVPEQCTLAQWAYENCLREQAHTHAMRVLALDAENAWARRILDNCGYINVEGAWVDEEPYLKAHGLERIDGQLVSADIAQARRDYRRASQAYAQARSRLDEATTAASGAPQAATTAQAEATKADAAEAAADKTVTKAEAALDKVRSEPVGTGDQARRDHQNKLNKAQEALTAARAKQTQAKKAADRAHADADSAASASKRTASAIPELEAACAKAQAALSEAASKLPADDPELQQQSQAPVPAPETRSTPTPEPKPPVQTRRLRAQGSD